MGEAIVGLKVCQPLTHCQRKQKKQQLQHFALCGSWSLCNSSLEALWVAKVAPCKCCSREMWFLLPKHFPLFPPPVIRRKANISSFMSCTSGNWNEEGKAMQGLPWIVAAHKGLLERVCRGNGTFQAYHLPTVTTRDSSCALSLAHGLLRGKPSIMTTSWNL